MITRTVRGFAPTTSRISRSIDGGSASVLRSWPSLAPIIGSLPTTTTATSAARAAATASAMPSPRTSQRSRAAWPVAVDRSSMSPPGSGVRRNVSRTNQPSGRSASTRSSPSAVTVRYLSPWRRVTTSSPHSKTSKSPRSVRTRVAASGRSPRTSRGHAVGDRDRIGERGAVPVLVEGVRERAEDRDPLLAGQREQVPVVPQQEAPRRAAGRASSRCGGVSMAAAPAYGPPSGSNSPSRTLISSLRRTARSLGHGDQPPRSAW